MDVSRIPAAPDARAAAFAVLTGLGSRDLTLPADASTQPVLPVGEHWVTSGDADPANGIVVYVHGGGFSHRNPPLMNLIADRLSRDTRRPVLVVHYPLAPADPFPAPLDAVLATYRQLLTHVEADRVVFYCESSGGALTLSALLELAAAEMPAGVVAVSAVTDLTLAGPSIDANAPTDAGVTREMLAFLVGQYLAGAPADRAPQSPLFGDLSALPPLLMIAGGAEALLDDTLRFADAATAAGVKTQVDVYEAMPHAFALVALDDDNPTGRVLRSRITTFVRTVTPPTGFSGSTRSAG
jgi:monoterpene epsilon-lactone hydrolase